MKTINIIEFVTLAARNDWQREQVMDYEATERQFEEWNEETEERELREVPHVYGGASKVSTLDGIQITYTEGFSFDEFEPDTFSASTEGLDTVWQVEGVKVVDLDGEELDAHEIAQYLPNDNFSYIDYSGLEIRQITGIDVGTATDAETYIVRVDNAPDLKFAGELIASARSSDDRADGDSYSGRTGQWTELALYKTKGGKFICQQIDRTLWQGERNRFKGKVCETLEEVKEFFRGQWLAKELFDELG